jgi:hypothetical protein
MAETLPGHAVPSILLTVLSACPESQSLAPIPPALGSTPFAQRPEPGLSGLESWGLGPGCIVLGLAFRVSDLKSTVYSMPSCSISSPNA